MEIIPVTKELFRGYIEEYCQMYNMCFRQNMTLKEATWRYLEHPKDDLLAYFALDQGKLVASYSASPMELLVDGSVVNVIQSLNTMTHPDYIGQGLFVELARLTYQRAADSGYQLVFGFPNQLSNRTFLNRLNWKDIYEVPTLQLTVDKAAEKRAQGATSLVREDSSFQLDYSRCVPSCTTGIMVHKTQAFLQWRYFQNPSNQYTNFVLEESGIVHAYAVCKEFRDRLNIIDFFAPQQMDMESLFTCCIEYAMKLGKHLVTTWAQQGTPEHLYLEKLGFQNSVPITYFGACVFDGEDPKIYCYRNWTIRMGDDNVY